MQTGPGLPTWDWDTASLTFNAPVRQDQELQLWLAPPPVNLVLSLARAALLIALALLDPAAADAPAGRVARAAAAARRG